MPEAAGEEEVAIFPAEAGVGLEAARGLGCGAGDSSEGREPSTP